MPPMIGSRMIRMIQTGFWRARIEASGDWTQSIRQYTSNPIQISSGRASPRARIMLQAPVVGRTLSTVTAQIT